MLNFRQPKFSDTNRSPKTFDHPSSVLTFDFTQIHFQSPIALANKDHGTGTLKFKFTWSLHYTWYGV